MATNVLRVMGLILAAILAALPASAQNADEIVQACVEAMGNTVERTAHQVGVATNHGIRVINQLDDEGASDRALIGAARRAVGNIDHQAGQGARQIAAIAARTVQALRRIDAEDRYFEAVAVAKHRAMNGIQSARRRGSAAVGAALQEALDD